MNITQVKKNAFGAFAADPTSKPFDKSLRVSPKRTLQGMLNTSVQEDQFRWFTPQSHIDSDKISHLS